MNPNEQLRRFHTAPADARRLLPSGRMQPNDAGVAPMPAAARAALATDPAAPVGDLTTTHPTTSAELSDASSPMPAAARARPAPADSTPPYAAATAGAGASSGPPPSPAALATDPAAPVGDLTTTPPTTSAELSDASSPAPNHPNDPIKPATSPIKVCGLFSCEISLSMKLIYILVWQDDSGDLDDSSESGESETDPDPAKKSVAEFIVESTEQQRLHVGRVSRGSQSVSIPEEKLSGGSKERKCLDNCCFDPESESSEYDGGDSACRSCGKSHNNLSCGESADLSSAWLSSLKAVWSNRFPIQLKVRKFLSEKSEEFRKNPEKFPDLSAQLVQLLAKAANPESHESLEKLSTLGSRRPRFSALEGESRHGITFDLDMPKDLYWAVFEVEFWSAFLEICLSDQADHLPIQAEEIDAPSIEPHETLLLFWTRSEHCVAVLIGKVQYQWVNPTNRTTGSMERLQAALLRVEDGQTRNAFFHSTYVVASDSDNESETDSERCLDPSIRGDYGTNCFIPVGDPDSLDCQHPTNTLFRFQSRDNSDPYRHLRGRERPGSHISGPPVVSLFGEHGLCPHFQDNYRIESVRPVHEIMKGGHLFLEIGSRRLCQDFKFLLLYCRDSGRHPQRDETFFREIFGALEQVFYKGKESFCYPLFFQRNWCSPMPYDEGDRLEAAFVFPTGDDGAGLTVRTVMRLSEKQPGTVLEVHTTFVTVGRRPNFYLDTSDNGPGLNDMIGSNGVSECRAALKKILNAECEVMEVNINPDTLWTEALKGTYYLSAFNTKGRKSSKNDPRDLRNMAGFLEVIAAGSIPAQCNFIPKVDTRNYDVHMVGDYECVQTAGFGLRNNDSKQPFHLIAKITVSRIIRETDESGQSLGGRRKATARPTNGRARFNQVAIDMKITFERVENDLWPPKEQVSNGEWALTGVGENVFAEYLRSNGIWVPAASDILHAFKNGGQVNVPLDGRWERFYYMGRVVSMRKQLQKLLGLIFIITGGAPPAYFPLAPGSFPTSFISGGSFISGKNEVPDRYVEIRFQENDRPFQDNLVLKIQVSLIQDENFGGGISSSNTAVINQDEVRDILLFFGLKAVFVSCSYSESFSFGRDRARRQLL